MKKMSVMTKTKNGWAEVITFKADAELKALLEGLPNRSEFIREAIRRAHGQLCPVCKGAGFIEGQRCENQK